MALANLCRGRISAVLRSLTSIQAKELSCRSLTTLSSHLNKQGTCRREWQINATSLNYNILSPLSITCVRHYAELPPYTIDAIRERVMGVLQLYDKINRDKLNVDCHFINDLGLDSLDQVEIVMAMEDEFGFEIPDGHAEKLLTPKDLIEYIGDRTEAAE